MDCKTASDLIMKYLDKEITDQEQKLLYGHMDSCEECKIEFEILKDACFVLEDAEFEEPPEDLERKVIARIKREDALIAKHKGWRVGISASVIILTCWVALTYLFLYTPAVSILVDSFDNFLRLSRGLFAIVLEVWGIILSGLVRMFTVARALKVVQMAIIDMYSFSIIVMILSMGLILKLYGYMFKTVRR